MEDAEVMTILTIDEIRRELEKADAPWEARETAAWRRGADAGEDSGLFGLRLADTSGTLMAASGDSFDDIVSQDLPASFDWRDHDKVRASRDQGQCGSCVAFATIAAIESNHAISTGHCLDLSEAELFHCNGGSCERGWGLAAGLAAGMSGLARLADAPWVDVQTCRDAPKIVRVTRYTELRSPRARRAGIIRGPVVAGMKVYRDFIAYGGGIYRHVVGEFVANHAVCVIGYNDEQDCWLVKNSWGSDFGEDGVFKIAYGQCALDENPFYSLATEEV